MGKEKQKCVHRNPVLDYGLTDFLEMEYSADHGDIAKVKASVFEQPIRAKELLAHRSASVENVLIVVHDGIPKQLRKLMLLDSDRKQFHVLPINWCDQD